jgi:hypothetical protein
LDAALALFLPLVGGYLFVVGYTALKYRVAREEGHRLYFRVAYHGVCLFLVSLVICGLLYALCKDLVWFGSLQASMVDAVRPLLKSPDHAGAQLGFIVICLGSIVLGRASPPILNRLFKGRINDALWTAAQESELEELLLEAMALLRTISITMSSSKVYVGLVLTTPEPKTERRVIALLPYMSGYRTETGKVNFTTYYDQFYTDPQEDADQFRLILPIDKMLSLSFFDVNVYADFQRNSPPVLREALPDV